MILISLAADFHWTQRCWWVGTPVISLLVSAAFTGLSSFPVITLEVYVELLPIDANVILNRCEEVRACPVWILYVRSDESAGEFAFFYYHYVNGGFSDAHPREGGYGSRPAQSSYGSRYPRKHAYLE